MLLVDPTGSVAALNTFAKEIMPHFACMPCPPAAVEEEAMKQSVAFYSEGCKLSGDLYLPQDLRASDRCAGIVLCHGYTGVKDLYLPDNARLLNDAGYIVLTFDYKGWGASGAHAAGWRPTAAWPTSRRR